MFLIIGDCHVLAHIATYNCVDRNFTLFFLLLGRLLGNCWPRKGHLYEFWSFLFMDYICNISYLNFVRRILLIGFRLFLSMIKVGILVTNPWFFILFCLLCFGFKFEMIWVIYGTFSWLEVFFLNWLWMMLVS